VADFYAARSRIIPPLPWQTIAPPFSGIAVLKQEDVCASEAEAIAALNDFGTLWGQLFPAEQARIIQLLVRRVTVTAAGLAVDIRTEGITGVIREMIAPRSMEAAE
jgi:hypothetical protein